MVYYFTGNIRLIAVYLIVVFFPAWLMGQEREITHEMSAAEAAMKHLIGKDYRATDPPPGPVRNIAEFEQMQGVLIRYPFGISYQLIAAMSQETGLTTIVANSGQENYVKSQYIANGVNMGNCTFLHAPTDSYWVRDYGPWYIAFGNDSIGIVDFIYNRPRPDDDVIPLRMAEFLGISYFAMDLVHTGGNYMTEGWGISASTELVWQENPTLTHQQINDLMNAYLGIGTYHVVPDPNNTYIDHIDCWAKFLDVDKVLVREVPPSHPQYDEIEAAAAYFGSQVSGYGNYYQVYRVYTPGNEPYTNSLILNNRVFVPIMGSSWDDEAIASYEEAMPGYEVLGFTGSWESTDALHCRTKGISDLNMLYVIHSPLLGTQPFQTEYLVEAEITAYSKMPVVSDSVRLFFRINSGAFQTVTMTHQGGKLYSAVIPGAAPGSEVAYYLRAVDASGKATNHPLIGHHDPHIFIAGPQPYPDIQVSISELNASANAGFISTDEFEITNNGQVGLTWDITCSTVVGEPFDLAVIKEKTSVTEQWLSVAPGSGTIDPGISQPVQVTCDATLLDPGQYEGTLTITSNDPDQPEILIPVHFTVDIASGIPSPAEELPDITFYPNPFTGMTRVGFTLPEDTDVRLVITDSRGSEVTTLLNQFMQQGDHVLNWNGTNRNGQKLKTGVYYFIMTGINIQATGKVILH
ncbi:MAG: agmatine deiminase family protein [Bacteroidales bacterium]|nr:agmatine deiminase family protein [Bacteroidales bacterium]